MEEVLKLLEKGLRTKKLVGLNWIDSLLKNLPPRSLQLFQLITEARGTQVLPLLTRRPSHLTDAKTKPAAGRPDCVGRKRRTPHPLDP